MESPMSDTALVAPAPSITSDQLALIKRTVAKDATAEELDLFFYDCMRHGVHPLDKLIHFTKRKGKYTPITSIDLMRSRAAETGEMAGSDDPEFGHDDEDKWSKVTVYRLTQAQRFPYSATARWSEYYPGEGDIGFMWRKMPHTMLGKCAEALALRKAFPKQLSGLYAREEMAQADVVESPAPARATNGQVIDHEAQPALIGSPERPMGDPEEHRDEAQAMFPVEGLPPLAESLAAFANGSRRCPSCQKDTIRKGAKQYGGGWYCAQGSGGCGTKFREGVAPAVPAPAAPAAARVEPMGEAEERKALILKAGKIAKDMDLDEQAKLDAWSTCCGNAKPDNVDPAAVRDLIQYLERKKIEKAARA
jgi:phage recombination protein Bet